MEALKMAGIEEILKKIHQNYSITKKVEFTEAGLTFELAPLTSKEELMVSEFLKGLEGLSYFEGLKRCSLSYAIKKVNDVLLGPEVLLDTPEGKVTKQTPIYLREEMEKWPGSFRDALFNAYDDLILQLEKKIGDSIKYEKFKLPKTEEDTKEKEKFKPIVEEEDVKKASQKVDLKDADAVNKIVEKEREMVDSGRFQAEEDAIKREETAKRLVNKPK